MSSSASSTRPLTILLTGITGEIGRAIGELLSSQGHTLILPVRDLKRGAAIVESIKKSTGNTNIHLEEVDLASRTSIQSFIHRCFPSKYSTLDVLLNNAAATSHTRQMTKDGLELQFGCNIYAYWLLMEGLRPILNQSLHPRIVNVASNYAGDLQLNDLQWLTRKYDNNAAYRATKQGDRMISSYAADLYQSDNILVVSCHPGVVTSPLLQNLGMSTGYDTPTAGAATPVFLATSSTIEFSKHNGTYWYNQRLTNCPFGKDKKQCEALWKELQRIDQQLAQREADGNTATSAL